MLLSHLLILIHLFGISLLVIVANGQVDIKQESYQRTFTFTNLNQCKRNEFYDLNIFSCASCDGLDENLEPTPDQLSCQCSKNSVTVAMYDASLRRPICMRICNKTTIETKKTSSCWAITDIPKKSCKFNYVRRENSSIQIFQNKRNHSDWNCSHCDLKSNYQYREFCIANTLLKGYLNYNSIRNIPDLKFIVFFCQSLHNITACNNLANLCVKSHFTFEKNSPCSIFLLTQASDALIKYSGIEEDLQNLHPHLFYEKGKETAKSLSQTVRSAAYELSDPIHLFATFYSLDGSLLRWETLKVNHLNLCQMDARSAFEFGRRLVYASCVLSLDNIVDLANIYANEEFVNIYLNYSKNYNNEVKNILQPMPILIEDLVPENQHANMEEWQLVTRFQMFKGEKSNNPILSQHSWKYDIVYKLQQFKSIRFPISVEIEYKIMEQHFITIPVMKIRYRTIMLSANSSLDELYNFVLRIDFRQHLEPSHLLHNIAFPILLITALLFAILRGYNYKNRHPTQEFYDSACMLQFFLHLITNIADAFLIFLILLIFDHSIEYFRGVVTVPRDTNEFYFEMLLYVGLALKTINLAIYFWRVGHHDCFFIDWERPKGHEPNLINNKTGMETLTKVSSWRTVFIANEWIKLSSKQKTSIFVQGFLSLITFNILENQYLQNDDIMLKIFLTIVTFSGTHIAQLLVRQFIIDGLFCECPLRKFTSTCSLANISVFTLMEPSYGFYIHGRSPHGFSDTDMSSMLLQLQRESQNMCGKRGLLNDSDQQTYVILPPAKLRIYIERFLLPLQKSGTLSQSRFQKELNNYESNLDKTSLAYNGVNRFFCAFIDHVIKDIDYIIKEKTFFENLLNCEFDNYLTESKGTFYIDNNSSFSQLFLYGNHQQIFIIEIFLLIAMFSVTSNIIVSVGTICLLNKIFCIVIRKLVRQNIANKTLIDIRFLI